jgi:putative membrane protein
MRKRIYIATSIIAVVCLGWTSISTASGSWNSGGSSPSALSPLDAWYLRQAQHTNAFEIAAAQLALTKSADGDVREYASMLLTDHQQQSQAVAELAARKFVPVPTTPSPVQEWVLERLGEASPAEFDAQYISSQIGGHEEAIALTTKEATWGSDWEIRSLAQTALPVLQGHFAAASALAG